MILVLIFGISASFAADLNQTENIQTEISGDDILQITENDDIERISDDVNILKSENTGNFTELNNTITSYSGSSDLKLTKDYEYKEGDVGTTNYASAFAGILIDKDGFVLNGDGHYIDAKHTGGNNYNFVSIRVTADNVVLKNLIFIGGQAHGGAIYVAGKNVQIINCTFKDGGYSARYNAGGGIYVSATNCVIERCNFQNLVGSQGPAIFTTTGARHTIIKNSNFTKCTASGHGGAILQQASDGEIFNCNFIENTAGDRGAGIYLVTGSDNLVYDCNFKDNSAKYGAIAVVSLHNTFNNLNFDNNHIINSGHSVAVFSNGLLQTFNNCTFKNHDIEQCMIQAYTYNLFNDCKFINNSVKKTTGLMYIPSGNIYVGFNNCTFDKNKGQDNQPLFNIGTNAFLVLNNTTIINNNFNGPILKYAATASSSLIIDHAIIKNNNASSIIKSAGLNIFDSTIADNNVTDNIIDCSVYTWINNTEFNSNSAENYIISIGNNSIIDNSKFIKNTINNATGYVINGGGKVLNINAQFTDNNRDKYDHITSLNSAVLFVGPNASGKGTSRTDLASWDYAYNNICSGGTIILTEGTYKDIYQKVIDKKVTVTGEGTVTIINENTGTTSPYNIFRITADCVNINNIDFQGGRVVFGTIYILGANYVKITNCTFTGVTSPSGSSNGRCGAGVHICYSYGTEIDYCNFTRNSGSSGSGLNFNYMNTPYGRVTNCNFIGINGGNGAAIETYSYGGWFENNTFADCTGSGTGGALALYSGSPYSTILNCTFTNNSANTIGGAIGCVNGDSYYANIINCTMIGNNVRSATGTGGGIGLQGRNSNIINCIIENNTASKGGGIYASTLAVSCSISNCTINNNNATGNGGAICFDATDSSIFNCIFINNSAVNGGAVYSNAKNSTVDDCKFENNNATDGSNFYATEGNPITITNCGFDLFYVTDDGTGDGLRMGAPTSFVNAVQSIENGGRVILIGTFTNLKGQNVGKPVIIEGYDNAAVINLLDANSRAFTVDGDDVIVKGITFKNSAITDDGGVILWNGANGKVDSCTFDNNTATNGGAIYWTGVNGNVTSSTFTKNTATANGGAIYWAGDNGAIESSTFSNNNAIYGSAVFLKTGVSTFELKDTEFTSNAASNSGTVAAEKLTTFSLGGNTFTSNTVGSGDIDYYFYDNAPIITSSLVYVSPSGSATSNGLTESTPTTLDHAVDSIIEDGGQIVFLAGNYNFERTLNNLNLTFVGRTGAVITGSRTSRVFTITGSSNIVFDGLTFSDLSFGSISADSVISASSSNVDIKNSEFKTITGTNLASIITYDASSTGNIVDSTFTSNTATNIVNINGNVNISGSSFTSNSGRTSSVSYNSGSKGTISGTTFSSNSGTYRNLYVNSNNVAVTGNTFDTTASLNSVSTVIYPNNVVISGTFNTGSNYAFSGISAKNGNSAIATGSVSGNTYSATWTKPLPGTYTVTLANTDNKGNTFNYASTPSVTVPVRLTTVYIGPSATGAKTGIDSSNLATWDNVAGILTDDGTVVFTAGIYSNFYGKTISKSWKVTGSGSVILDANNNGRIFTINANNVEITGITFKNGEVSGNQGSAISWTGTGGKITNSIFNENTGVPISSANDLTITNTQMKNQISLTKSNINWGATETIKATFSHSAPSTVTVMFNGNSQGSYAVSSKVATAAVAFTNPSTQAVGSYVVTDLKNILKEVL